MVVWQIAAGETGRDYTKLFLDYDVMFMGPGNPGAYDKQVYDDLVVRGLLGKDFATQLRQFCTEVKGGDIVLLRLGSKAKAIGLIRPWRSREYLWTQIFDDVYGWDLQHTHRVIWQEHLTDELLRIQKSRNLFHFRGPAFSRFRKNLDSQLKDLLNQCKSRALKPLPSVPEPLTLEELGTELFSKGLPNEDVDKFILAIQRQRRLAKWYRENRPQSKKPAEHEVVAHMILPFMLALGWSEQLLAVEWNRIDLVAFSCTPRKKENVCLLCEAKEYGHGLQNTFPQATKYVKKLKLDNCKRIFLTDGERLYLHQRKQDDSWDENPVGYLNVKLIRTNHIAPARTSAVDTIMALTPAGINRELV